MWQNTKKLKASYDSELLKQTNPYGYYLKNIDSKDMTNEGEHENVPFICIDEIKILSENDEFTIYDYKDYILYESKKGSSSDEERKELLTNAIKLNADLIYSDVDHVDSNGEKHTPFYKPDYSIDTFKANDLYSDFYAVKKSKSRLDIALLENVAHVTKTLYHYKCSKNHREINKLHGIEERNNVCYLTDDIYIQNGINSDNKDKISIIIPSKDNPELIKVCLDGIKRAKIKSKINTLEVVIVDNGSSVGNRDMISHVIEKITDAFATKVELAATLDIDVKGIDEYKNDSGFVVKYVYKVEEFNFSAMCNRGAKASEGDYLLFLNDDIEITDELFLYKLLHFAQMNHIGAVGCKLLYPGEDRKIQHIGITCLKYAGPSHKLSTFSDDSVHYFGKNVKIHNHIAVTGACLMVSREKYFKIGGFYDKMKVGYNDVDLCISLYEKGLLNVVNNDCILIHHESVTRGSDLINDKKLERLDRERQMLYDRHPFILEKGDPFYNPNLAEDFLDYRVNVIPDFERRDYVSEERKDLAFKVAPVFKEHLLQIDAGKSINQNGQYAVFGRNIFTNIEKTVKNRGYYDITGWGIINKKHNYFYDIYIVIIGGSKDESVDDIVKIDGNVKALKRALAKGELNSQVRVFSTVKVYREDLGSVFPEAYETELSGFMARIPASIYDKPDISLGVLIINKQSGKKYYAGYNKPNI